MPVVVMFTKGQGKPKQDLLQVKDDVIPKNLDAVFLATNNLTYAAGARASDCFIIVALALVSLVMLPGQQLLADRAEVLSRNSQAVQGSRAASDTRLDVC